MSDGDELDREEARRAARLADELVAAVLGAGDEDLDRTLGRVKDKDAPAVLGALVRHLAGLVTTNTLREIDPADSEPAADDDDDATAAAGDDDGMPADPWATSGETGSNALEEAGALFEGLAGPDDVAGLGEWRARTVCRSRQTRRSVLLAGSRTVASGDRGVYLLGGNPAVPGGLDRMLDVPPRR